MAESNLKLILIISTLDCTTFHSFNANKKIFKNLAGLWLAGEMVDHIGIYGSKVAEGLSAFQRRSCFISNSFNVDSKHCALIIHNHSLTSFHHLR